MLIKFIDSDGLEHVVNGAPGQNAMRCATEHLVPGIVGECGGAMACATCHGYVDAAWLERLPPADAQEREMLGGVIEPRAQSRLTCQIQLTDELDGLTIRIPRSQI